MRKFFDPYLLKGTQGEFNLIEQVETEATRVTLKGFWEEARKETAEQHEFNVKFGIVALSILLFLYLLSTL